MLFVLVSTFGAVAIGSFAYNQASAERKRALRVLEAQVGDFSNLRKQQLTGSFTDRVLLPFLSRVGATLRRFTPVDVRKKIHHKLVLAGSPGTWDADKIVAFKILGVVAGLGFAVLVSRGGDGSATQMLALGALMAGILFFIPDGLLNRVARERQQEIRRSLPDTMDLLTISVEAGLGFDAALQQVIKNVPGPLTAEIGRMLQEMRLGVPRVDAFRSLADRTDVDELRSFVLAMVQADTFGVSISKVLRAQSGELRTKRRQFAEEQAMKVPIKILFPLVLCVLPALFIVVLGPGVIKIAANMFGLEL